jgi:hypothetical protein
MDCPVKNSRTKKKAYLVFYTIHITHSKTERRDMYSQIVLKSATLYACTRKQSEVVTRSIVLYTKCHILHAHLPDQQ